METLLNWIRCSILSQWSNLNAGVIRECLGVRMTVRASAFWICWRRFFGWRAVREKGITVVESLMNKSGGNGGGSTVVDSVADAPKITYMLVTGTWKGGYLLRKGKGWVEDKPRFLAKGVGEIGCALGRESEGLIILMFVREANEKKFSFRWIKS